MSGHRPWSDLKKRLAKRKEESQSPSSDQEKEIALPQTNDSGNSHSVDLHSELAASEVICRNILKAAELALKEADEFGEIVDRDEPSWKLVGKLVKNLSYIAVVARGCAGSGTDNTGSIPFGPTETYKRRISQYPPGSPEADAWADGYTTGFSDQNLVAAKLIEDAAARIRKGEDPPVHPGPVVREAPGE